MAEPDSDPSTRQAGIRRLKWMLRFTPRRAVFHRYPLVDRFATLARRRAYLWSFKPQHVRPAIYFGAVLSFWPVMGGQLLLAFVASLFLRCNLMVIGALQFITNPLTAAPIYYATYHAGRSVLTLVGLGARGVSSAATTEAVTISVSVSETLPRNPAWASAFGSTVMALFVGGTVCGLALAIATDLLYTIGSKSEHPRK